MNKILTKFLGYSLLIGINLLIIIFVLLFLMEFVGISKYLNNKQDLKKTFLHETNYYGEKLDADPYQDFVIQYLHPYYLFSLPHKSELIKKNNTKYVSLNSQGFRNSFKDKKNKYNLVFLGGSSAFGHGSSSDDTTISSLVSMNSNFNVVNLNAPSWNTHQELVALSKHINKYEISVSYSGANDIGIYCNLKLYKENKPFKDLPESYYRLSEYFENIRGETVISTSSKVKKFFIFKFPETYKIYTKLKKNLINKKNDFNVSNEKKEFCGGDKNIDNVVESFLNNQKSMRNLSEGRGATHWLILQPLYELHKNVKNQKYKGNILTNNRIEFKKTFFRKIMNSNFCKKNCLDFTNIFNEYELYNLIYDTTIVSNTNNTLFLDNVHLLDSGSEIVSKNIISNLDLDKN